MSYSSDKPFKDREHILWEIGFCNRATNYVMALSLACILLGVISDLLSMKLALSSTSWFLFSIVAAVISLAPHLHVLMAKHLLGMEIIKKDQQM